MSFFFYRVTTKGSEWKEWEFQKTIVDKYNQSTLYIWMKLSISKLMRHTKQLSQQSEGLSMNKGDKFERKNQHLWNMEYVFLLLLLFLLSLQTIVFQKDTYIILWSFSLLAPITHLFNHIHLLNTCLLKFVFYHFIF